MFSRAASFDSFQVATKHVLLQKHSACAAPPLDDVDDFYRQQTASYPGHKVTIASMRRLLRGEWISDETMIAGIAALVDRNPARCKDIAILSPYDMSSWRARIQPEQMYRRVKWTVPWQRKIVIIPIHKDFHWTLVAVWPAKGHIEVFDSAYATRTREAAQVRLHLGLYSMSNSVQSCASFISAIWQVARDRGDDVGPLASRWVCQPMLVRRSRPDLRTHLLTIGSPRACSA